MLDDGTFKLVVLLGAALAGFGLGVWLWRALTMRDRRETAQRHANEIKDLRDRWQQAQRQLEKASKQSAKASQVRAKSDQAALVRPKDEAPPPAREKPIAPELPVAPTPAVVPQPSAMDSDDDLKRIKGVGKALERRLREMDVRTYAQIAAWTDADVDRVEAGLNSIPGRIRRDRWVEQARKLAG